MTPSTHLRAGLSEDQDVRMLKADPSPIVDTLVSVLADYPRITTDSETLLSLSLACGEHLGVETQVRDLAAAEGLFLREVLLTGIVVLLRDPIVLAELTSKMLVFTEDMLPNVRMMRAAQKERFIGGT